MNHEAAMALKSWWAAGALIGLAMLAAPPQATAQFGTSALPSEPTLPQPANGRRRIEINPRPLQYRRCTSWLEIQHRPSGTVLFPQMHCWWVRG